jgi:hypothetical protein
MWATLRRLTASKASGPGSQIAKARRLPPAGGGLKRPSGSVIVRTGRSPSTSKPSRRRPSAVSALERALIFSLPFRVKSCGFAYGHV